MKAVLALLSCLVASTVSAPKNDLTCSICVDVVTDIDNFLTSDTTEQEIVEFVEQICSALGAILPDLEATCKALVESQLPAIIEGLVEGNLNPQEVCNSILACP
eukprot:GFUD01092590.1.p2 GENE.GFUD01092590.1~~GFUD01092590.1.p2  ORF type:complete len:116 (-),score=41.96 GFUD01092590.1:33-344(-)